MGTGPAASPQPLEVEAVAKGEGGPAARMGPGSSAAARLQPLKGGRSQSRKALALDSISSKLERQPKDIGVHLTSAGLAAEATPVAGRGSLNGAISGSFAPNVGPRKRFSREG